MVVAYAMRPAVRFDCFAASRIVCLVSKQIFATAYRALPRHRFDAEATARFEIVAVDLARVGLIEVGSVVRDRQGVWGTEGSFPLAMRRRSNTLGRAVRSRPEASGTRNGVEPVRGHSNLLPPSITIQPYIVAS